MDARARVIVEAPGFTWPAYLDRCDGRVKRAARKLVAGDGSGIAETAQVQQCLRSRWEASTGEAERARIIRAAIPNVTRQLELVRTRQRGLAEFADELAAKLQRMQALLADLQPPTTPGRTR